MEKSYDRKIDELLEEAASGSPKACITPGFTGRVLAAVQARQSRRDIFSVKGGIAALAFVSCMLLLFSPPVAHLAAAAASRFRAFLFAPKAGFVNLNPGDGVGAYTFSSSGIKESAGTTAKPELRRWTLRTVHGTFEGEVAPGENAERRHFKTQAGLLAVVPGVKLPARMPAYCPFTGAVLAGSDVFLFYDCQGAELLIHQTPLSRTASLSGSVGAVEHVGIRGRNGAWLPEAKALEWATTATAYGIYAPSLNKDSVLEIANSLP